MPTITVPATVTIPAHVCSRCGSFVSTDKGPEPHPWSFRDYAVEALFAKPENAASKERRSILAALCAKIETSNGTLELSPTEYEMLKTATDAPMAPLVGRYAAEFDRAIEEAKVE